MARDRGCGEARGLRCQGARAARVTLGRPRVGQRAPSGRGAAPPRELLGLALKTRGDGSVLWLGPPAGFLPRQRIPSPTQHFIHSVFTSRTATGLCGGRSRASGADGAWTR